MNEKKEAVLLAQERPQAQTIEPTNNVNHPHQDVNSHNALRELRLAKEIPVADMVAIVQQRYPGYDKHLQSKAERSHHYGIRLCDDALEDLQARYAPAEEPVKQPKPDKRTLPCRISCRMSVLDYNLLMDCITEEGFSTTQDWLYSHLKKYLRAKGVYQ